MEEMLQVGVIASTHGIKGEVKVFPTTDDVGRFKKLKQVYLDTGREKLLLDIESVKFFKQMVILKFRQFGDINEVEGFRKKPLLVKREDALPLEENEYYIADMLGMDVVLEDGGAFGKLSDVIETGANDVYVVDTKQYGQVLLPAIKECILSVDIEKGQMCVRLMKGLV